MRAKISWKTIIEREREKEREGEGNKQKEKFGESIWSYFGTFWTWKRKLIFLFKKAKLLIFKITGTMLIMNDNLKSNYNHWLDK